ncbi:ATP-binding protein [Rhizobium sp. A37_96]
MEVKEITGEEAIEILAMEESHFCDLKSRDIAPAKLTQSISSFANTAGGEIFVGISENTIEGVKQRTWVGFEDLEACNAILQVLDGIAPLSNFYGASYLRYSAFPGIVLHIALQKTRSIIYATNGTAYIRKGAQKLPVAGDEALKRLELDKGISSFEDETINIPLEDITNSVTTLEFMLNTVPTSEPEVWLRSQYLIQSGKPTVAGTLLFSDSPQAALPKRAAIKLFRYKSADEGINRETLAFDPLTVEGPIYDLIQEGVVQTKEIIEGIKKLGEEGLEDVSYPDETLHEIITNAVLHRDYSHPTDTQIRVYDDRVEIESPGRLPGHITQDNILDEQFARNPKLVRLINKFPNPPNKDVGEGLNTAFEAMRKIRLKDPEITQAENSVIVYIRHARLSSPAQIVVEYLESNDTITNQIGRNITGIRRDVQMKDIFVALRRRKLIEQVPGKRGKATAWRKMRQASSLDDEQETTES